jgi:drug/metabolite transporter (DMT)-like permease
VSDSQPLVVGLGVGSALSRGTGDFAGGFASRISPALGVVLASYILEAAVAGSIALIRRESPPQGADVGWVVAAGLAGAIGLACYYQGLAVGRMGRVAPVVGVLAAGVPTAFTWAFSGIPASIQVIAIGLAIGAVILATWGGREAGGAGAGLTYALVAGAAFGLFAILVSRAGTGGTFSVLAIARTASIVAIGLLVAARRAAWRPNRHVIALIGIVAVSDLAGLALFLLAAQSGRLDIASTLSSLYPVVTVALAIIVLKEPVTRAAMIAVVLMVAAIVLFAAG